LTLLNQTVQVANQLPKFFDVVRDGTAPANFSRAHLKDIGFASSNHHAIIPLLKGLGFLTADGTPTERYKQYLDKTQSRVIMAQAVKDAYGDIFVIKAKPSKSDRAMIEGKFKSTYNLTELVASRAAATFLALLDLCDDATLVSDSTLAKPKSFPTPDDTDKQPEFRDVDFQKKQNGNGGTVEIGLRYNIQIHLPATKDIEVYNAIFRSIREHLIA
jgi:hypothetical protein